MRGEHGVRTYEAMFLLDPVLAADWPAAEAEVMRILGRADAKVLGLRNWEERKLAYQIGRHKRGLYVLGYFQATPERVAGLERDAQLSEQVLRVLVINRETWNEEAVQKALAADPPPKTPVRGDEWSDRPRTGAAADAAALRTVEADAAVATIEEPGEELAES
jgi:small subunit ribosomal protein S6